MSRAAFLCLLGSLIAGCAALPPAGGLSWVDALPVEPGILARAGAGPQSIEIDFEAATPQRAERLRQRGVQVPRVSRELADPRAHRDYIDSRVTAVGFSLGAGGYLLYCEGLPLPVLVPESHVDLGLTHAVPGDVALYPDRDAALAAGAPPIQATYAYYRGAGGALIVPTVFSPASTPRMARTMLAVRQHLGEAVQQELKVLLLGLTGTRVLQGVFSRAVRVGMEPALPPRQPPPRPAPSAPAPVPTPSVLAPSPGLVRALTGNNPTPAVAPGPRLPQDVAVSPRVPDVRRLDRSIGPSPSQNAQLQVDIRYLREMGATNIRVNQQQLVESAKRRVGINRPDLQFDYRGRRYHAEYDTPASSRGSSHQERITSNDPNAETILLTVP